MRGDLESFIGPGSEKKWYCISEDSPQGVWDNIAQRMLVEFAESGCPIFRATSPLSRGQLKSKGHGKLSIHYAADLEAVETIFRIIVSANHLSLYGAVAEICEEYESLRERTERPVKDHDNLSHETIMVNEADMHFRIPGLPHSVVKHAQSTSVRELIQKIENHPDRHALQQDLRQNPAYNPYSPESKKMIQDVGNIELCELLETEPKTQCKACLSYWNTGMIYCTCGHFLHKETVVNRKFVKFSMDLLSVPEHVIKKGRPHGHRYGKKPGDKEYYLANQLKKKCKKRQFQRIHDRFLRDHEFRIRMIEHHRDEEVCRRWDALADEDHTHHLTEQEDFYYKNKWWLHSNKQGSNTIPLRNRSDFKQALSSLERLKLQQEAVRRTIRAYLLLQAQTMAVGTEFIFCMVELARFLVVFLQFRKSRRRRAKS